MADQRDMAMFLLEMHHDQKISPGKKNNPRKIAPASNKLPRFRVRVRVGAIY